MDRRVLFLQPDRLTCYRQEKNGVVAERQWLIDLDGLPEDLRPYLKHSRQSEFNLLIDLPEEECHLESFTTISRRDQKHLIAKIQNKRFENALLTKADVTGSGMNQSKLSLLLSGIAKHKVCADLIRLLDQLEICVRAVHSPLTLTSALAKLSQSSKGACLFVIPIQGCYRLVACIDSFVFFNRRIDVPYASRGADFKADKNEKSELLKNCLTETLVYLQRQQVEGWETPVLIVPDLKLAAPGIKDMFKQMADSGLVSEIRNFLSPSIADSNPTQGLKPESKQILSNSYLPFGHWCVEPLLAAAACSCGNGYARRRHRSAYTARKVRNIWAALALCGLGGAVSSTAVAHKLTVQYEELMATYSESTIALQNTITEHDSTSEKLHEHSVEAVRQAMVTARLIELSTSHTPLDFLNEIAENVHENAGVSVSSVAWELEDLLNATSLTEMLSQPTAINTIDLEQVYRATVSGVVQGNPEASLTTFESFVSTLRHANAIPSVVVVETPFGLGSQDKTTMSSLSGATGEFLLELSTAGTER